MIPTAKKKPARASVPGIETKQYGLQASAKAFQILFDDLYSNKPESITRELWSNAHDSHVDAGNEDVPFVVKLPTNYESTWSIRDFGTSMTHDKIVKVYTEVFGSDKTDDPTKTGELGLGSKSVFAYTNSFTVTAFDGEEKRIYLGSLSEDMIPELILTAELPSEEPRGIEVQFAVKRQDMAAFVQAAKTAVMGHDTVPTVIGLPNFKKPTAVYEADGLAIYNRNETNLSMHTRVYIRQGSALYPVTQNEFRNVMPKRLKQDYQAVITVPVGSVDFVPSREALQLREDTTAYIIKRMKECFDDLDLAATHDLTTAPNFLEAQRRYRAWLEFMQLPEMKLFGRSLSPNNSAYIQLPLNGPLPTIRCYGRSPSSKKPEPIRNDLRNEVAFFPAKDVGATFVIDDGTRVVRSHLRLSNLAALSTANVYLLEDIGGKALTRFMRLTGVKRSHLVRLADLTDPGPTVRSERRVNQLKGSLAVNLSFEPACDERTGKPLFKDGMTYPASPLHIYPGRSSILVATQVPDKKFVWLPIDSQRKVIKLPDFGLDISWRANKDFLPLAALFHYLSPEDRGIYFLGKTARTQLAVEESTRFDVLLQQLVLKNKQMFVDVISTPLVGSFPYGTLIRSHYNMIFKGDLIQKGYNPHLVELVRDLQLRNFTALTDVFQEAEAKRLERVQEMKDKYPLLAGKIEARHIEEYMAFADSKFKRS